LQLQVETTDPRCQRHLQEGEQSMIRRLSVLVLLSILVIGGSGSVRPAQSASQEPCTQDHQAWVTHALEKMETIKPGMTRADLLKVFTAEGGLPPKGLQGLRRTFVSRDCPYFRIAVEFEPVARLDPRNNNAVFLTSIEDSRDIIVKVSRPYLQFAD
jgi:hypothetical protein